MKRHSREHVVYHWRRAALRRRRRYRWAAALPNGRLAKRPDCQCAMCRLYKWSHKWRSKRARYERALDRLDRAKWGVSHAPVP